MKHLTTTADQYQPKSSGSALRRRNNAGRQALLVGASALVMTALSSGAFAQDDGEAQDEIVVVGVRASLEQSMDFKRDADGVVDAISAEDIGKFPNTNLAESLQRITGVSINRVNGEGSEVTVRGFGGQFNLVTLNGRHMPSANVQTVGGDQDADFAAGSGRSFDFSNLASEGVNGLQVYKTARAAAPGGGLGATINISTARPLDGDGLRGSVSLKGLNDTSVVNGDDITPEVSGILSWTNDTGNFGVGLFGSYQKRDSSSVSATVNGWNVSTYDEFINNGALTTPGASIQGAPSGDTLVTYPNDSRFHLADASRERLNGQIVVQFAPTENIILTGDVTYAENATEEQRTDQTNWFARPWDEVVFEGSPVSSTTFLHESLSGDKDMGFEQQYRGNKDELLSIGFNAEFELWEDFTAVFDVHSSKAESNPDNPMGASSTLFSMGAPVILEHSLNMSNGIPVQMYTIDDSVKGNGNGMLDVGDLGSQVARTVANAQEHDIDEVRFDVVWDRGGNSTLQVGADYRKSKLVQTQFQTQQTLGDWGIGNPGDVEMMAPGLVETYCLSCLFEDHNPGMADVAFRASAVELYNTISPLYAAMGNSVNVTADSFNQVEEDIFGLYAQFSLDTEFMGMPARLLAGVRYEETDVTSTSNVAPPAQIIWQADDDFTITTAAGVAQVGEGSYSNFLPALDFSVDITEDLVGRISWGKSIGRADYGNLFASDTAAEPDRPTALGGVAEGTTGNPDLLPLISDNFDVSLEWYFDDSSYVSAGFFEKRVSNFVGNAIFEQNLFDLRDPSSGAAGTISGQALDALNANGIQVTDEHFFAMSVLIDNFGLAQAQNLFLANFGNQVAGRIDNSYYTTLQEDYDLLPTAADPLVVFNVTTPINNQSAKINGFELAGQHFFGDTGFGIAGSYTIVNGDVGVDLASDPSENQFALIGLSDTANVTGIYENYGFSARISYNWRDEFLVGVNRGGGRSPTIADAFGQVDASVSYDVNDNLQITFEGINLTGENLRTRARSDKAVWFYQELKPRYLLGARYRF